MENKTPKAGLHPLLTAAAISVTVFSAVGVGAMTGLLPHSFGSTKEAAPATELSASEQPAVQALPAAAEPAAAMPPASAAATPAHKPAAKKHVVAHTSKPAPTPRATEPDLAAAPPPPPPGPVAQAPVEAPRPVPAGVLGVVESVREVSTPAKESNGLGPIAGGIAGAVLGNQVGHGDGRTIATVLGAAAGAFGGKEIEKRVRATKHWEVSVRLDDGTRQTITSQSEPFWHGGERIRYLDGRLSPA